MQHIRHLLENNRRWAENVRAQDPEFFTRLAGQQSPDYLWIGCSDSRVPANTIVGLMPGEVFVHRNVANLVDSHDVNCMAVLQFAVDVLRVSHVIVCGHYGCGGVRAAFGDQAVGLITGQWLRRLREIYQQHAVRLGRLPAERRADALCELSVRHQVAHVAASTIVQQAWQRGWPLAVHGWIYAVRDGLIRDLEVDVTDAREAAALVERLEREARG
jgi:carbonic anhydrase